MTEHLPPRAQLGIVGLIAAAIFGLFNLIAQFAEAGSPRAHALAIANYLAGVLMGGFGAAVWTYPALGWLKIWFANDPWAVAATVAVLVVPLAPPLIGLMTKRAVRIVGDAP